MYGFVSADEAQAPRGKCMGRCHFMGANGLVSGWFAPICRRSTKGLELCEVIVALLVIDRSGSSFCGWIPFVVDTGTDVTIIPRKLLPDHAFRGMDLGICPVSGLCGGTCVGHRYPASILLRAPNVDGPSIHIKGLDPLVADVWHEPYGMLGMDVLQNVVMISDGTHFSFWPPPSSCVREA